MFKKEDGFTLIEMLIVLMIITVLILLIVPNLGKNTTAIYDDGCEALKQTITAQVHAYQLDEGELPDDLDVMVPEYITVDQTKCRKGNKDQVLEIKPGSNGSFIIE